MKISFANNKIILIILTLILGLVLFFKSGSNKENLEEKSQDKSVVVIESQSKPYSKNLKLVGKIDSSEYINLVTEFSGTIEKILAKSGSLIEKDQPILELDKVDYINKFNEANANLERVKVELDSTKKLYEKGLSSLTLLKTKEAELSSAYAHFKRSEYELNKRTIKAPLNGKINDISVDKGNFIGANSKVGSMVGKGSFKVIAYVSEILVKDLKLGLGVDILTSSGHELKSEINSIGNIVDPKTKTVSIEMFIVESDINLLHGETCSVIIKLPEVSAHLISPAYVILNEKGQFTVKILTEDTTVSTRKIDIIQETTEGIWISGLQDDAKIITLGNYYVKDGEKVNYTTSQAKLD